MRGADAMYYADDDSSEQEGLPLPETVATTLQSPSAPNSEGHEDDDDMERAALQGSDALAY